jgi:DNA-binding response OmpR family regulator
VNGFVGHIVLISDDEQLRSLLCGLLIAHGLVAVGSDTNSVLARRVPPCDVAIVDTCVNYAAALRALEQLEATSATTLAIFAKKSGAPAPQELVARGDVLLGKPFDPRELLLIVRGLLDDGTSAAPAAQSMVTAGPITLSTLLNTVTVAAREVELTDVETRILRELLLAAGTPVSRERLTRRSLLRDWSPHDRALDTHINRLRGKLGDDRRGRTPLRTLRGHGYLLLADWDPAEITDRPVN